MLKIARVLGCSASWPETCDCCSVQGHVFPRPRGSRAFVVAFLALSGIWGCAQSADDGPLEGGAPDSGPQEEYRSDAGSYEYLFRCDQPTPVERGGAVERCANSVVHAPACSEDRACGADILPNHLLATQGAGWCNTDGECGAGLMCIRSSRFISEQDPCSSSPRFEGFACQTRADSCGSDADCAAGECVFSAGRHQCVTRPSPACPRPPLTPELTPMQPDVNPLEDAGSGN